MIHPSSSSAQRRAALDVVVPLLADDQRARFCAFVDVRRAISVGEAVELAVDNEHLPFFDADTGTVLAEVHARSEAAAEEAVREVAAAYELGDEPVHARSTLLEVVD